MGGGGREGAGDQTTPPLERLEQTGGGDGDHPAAFRRSQQLAMIESMAQSLVEAALNEALEAHLRGQLYQTADETVRAAFAAATGEAKGGELGWTSGQESGADEEDSRSESEFDVSRARWSVAGEADDEYETNDNDNKEEEEDEDTLYESGQVRASSDLYRSHTSSVSPSRLDGADIFQDLGEMSLCADRIDLLLEQTASEHSTRSNASNFRQRSVSPFAAGQFRPQDGAEAEADKEDEID